MNTVYTVPAGKYGLILQDETLNNNDKTITFSSTLNYEITNIQILYASSSAAGTRTPYIYVKNASDVAIWQRKTADLTATQNGYITLSPYAIDSTTDRLAQTLNFPFVHFPNNWKLQIKDTAAISTLDDIYVHIFGRQLSL